VLTRPGPPLALATIGALAAAVVGMLAYMAPAGRTVDHRALEGFVSLRHTALEPWAEGAVHMADPLPYALVGLVLIGVAVARRRLLLAGAVVFLLFVTGATTQVLKRLLASERAEAALGWSVSDEAWPSGHATAAMTLALLAILVSPARLRPLVAVIGTTLALAVSYAILILSWHFPSDALGGQLVAGSWVVLVLAVLNVVERRRAEDPAPTAADIGLALAAATVVVIGVAAAFLARSGDVIDFARDHTSAAAATVVIAALGIALPATLAAGLARSR